MPFHENISVPIKWTEYLYFKFFDLSKGGLYILDTLSCLDCRHNQILFCCFVKMASIKERLWTKSRDVLFRLPWIKINFSSRISLSSLIALLSLLIVVATCHFIGWQEFFFSQSKWILIWTHNTVQFLAYWLKFRF